MSVTRPRNAAQTRADILSAARRRFGSKATIGRPCGPSPRTSVWTRQWSSGISAASRTCSRRRRISRSTCPTCPNVDPDDVAGILLPRFFAVWEEDETFLALLRAAMTSPLAAETLRRVFAEQVAPKLITATPDHPLQRIGLMGAFVIGLAITRYVLVNPPVAGLSREELSRWAAPVIKQLLVGPAPT